MTGESVEQTLGRVVCPYAQRTGGYSTILEWMDKEGGSGGEEGGGIAGLAPQ